MVPVVAVEMDTEMAVVEQKYIMEIIYVVVVVAMREVVVDEVLVV